MQSTYHLLFYLNSPYIASATYFHLLLALTFFITLIMSVCAKVLYTGDFSREEDRHLMAAEVPTVAPDVMIMESTYGTHVHEKREDREARFTGTIHHIVTRGGHCLIPVFALGRAQELLLILGLCIQCCGAEATCSVRADALGMRWP